MAVPTPTRTQSYVFGPAQLFLGTGAAGALQFCGWTEDGMEYTEEHLYENVMSDISGTKIPIDAQVMGRQAYMAGVLTVFNEPVFQAFRSSGIGNPGLIAAGEIGRLVNLEGGGLKMVVNGPYKALKPTVFANAGDEMEGQFWFPKAFLIGPQTVGLGTRVKRQRFNIQAFPIWNHVAGTAVMFYDNAADAAAGGFSALPSTY